MKLYYVPRTRATRPRWMLEELGVPYELVRLDPAKGENRTPEHLARHPLGHVPALEDDGVVMFESAAICLWLAERHPEKGLVPPPGTPARARTYQWLFFAATELEPPLGELSRQNRRPEPERDPAGLADARRRFLAAVAALEAPLSASAHLVGAEFTVADLVVGACVAWGKATLGGLEGLPAVEAWLARVRQRPAWKRATAD